MKRLSPKEAAPAPRSAAPTARRAAPYLAAAFAGIVFGLHRIVDPDVFQQVAAGREHLLHPSSIGVSSFHDLFVGQAYVADKWLASVVAALFDALGALALYQVALAVLAALGFCFLLRRWGAGPLAAAAGSAIGLAASAFRLEPRPETLSLALLCWLVGLLAPGAAWPARRRPWVAATLALWVNLHGYFVNGLLVLAAALAADALRPPRGTSRRDAVRAAGAALLAGFVASFLHPQTYKAVLWPLGQLLALRDQAILREAIGELAPTSSLFEGIGAARIVLAALTFVAAAAYFVPRSPLRRAVPRALAGFAAALPWLAAPPPGLVQWPYRLTAALFAAALFELPALLAGARAAAARGEGCGAQAPAAARGDRCAAPEAAAPGERCGTPAQAAGPRGLLPAFLFAGFAVLALPVVRNTALLPPAALLLLAPLWSAAAAEAGASPRMAALSRRGVPALAVAAFVLCCLLRLAGWLAPGTYRAPGWTGLGVDERSVPIAAAEFVAARPVRGKIVNDFQSGGALLRRLYPARRVFIAGNTSCYPASFLETYRREVMGGDGDPADLTARYDADVVVLAHAAMETPKLAARLARSPAWRLAHLDAAAAVFVRAADGDAPLDLDAAAGRLTAEARVSEPWPAWLGGRRSPFPALNAGLFLRAAGRPDLALRLGEKLWSEAPDVETATFCAGAAEEAGRLPEAVEKLEWARRERPADDAVRTWLARALFARAAARLAEPAAAGPDLERCLALSPGEPGAQLLLALVRAAEGRADEARRLAAEAWPRAPEPLRDFARRDPRLAPVLPR